MSHYDQSDRQQRASKNIRSTPHMGHIHLFKTLETFLFQVLVFWIEFFLGQVYDSVRFICVHVIGRFYSIQLMQYV